MIQYLFGISIGYLSLIINIPLALLVYFKVSKSLAIRSMVYVITFSVAILVLDHVDLSRFYYATENGTSAILGPLVAGVIYGTCYSYLLKASAYSGGTDFVAALIHKVRPDKSVLGLIFTMNAIVAVASYFVYDYKMEPVILCILYTFTSSTVSERNTKSGRSAIRFEIITDHPEELSKAIIEQLHHSATMIPGKGIYKGKETNLMICVVNEPQVPMMTAIIESIPGTFAVCSQVSEVMGNFKRLDNRGNQELQLLDIGDGSGI
jgi:uncharacterized membrane-anchored protein YitT (DUF2179 family)